jgi:hypothetical protein
MEAAAEAAEAAARIGVGQGYTLDDSPVACHLAFMIAMIVSARGPWWL